jgi:hypothetical protein
MKVTKLFKHSKQPSASQRTHVRHDCMIVATITVVDKHVTIDGLVSEISLGGVKFRPASTYILDRTSEKVSISMDGFVIDGTIRNTSQEGYGIQLGMKLEEEDLEAFSKYFKSNMEKAAAQAQPAAA